MLEVVGVDRAGRGVLVGQDVIRILLNHQLDALLLKLGCGKGIEDLRVGRGTGRNGELLGRLDSAGAVGIACAASGKAAQGDGAKAGKPSLEDKAARDGGVETIAMVASKCSHGITPFKIDVENGAKCALDARFSRNRIEQVEAACPRDPSKEARFMPSHQACPLTCSPI